MSEIAKCPICGEKPKWIPITGWESGWKTDMLMCCGYGSTVVRGWNQHAAAMELAHKLKELSQCDLSPHSYLLEKQVEAAKQFEAAEQRVLEVFK